ncbi:MAG: biotin carboxyl carrier domain-containing protein [Chloroflexi bacterium]|nr:biotin carboxyl carrier domain-containing protein [Chloroflexota bacterium]
MTTERPDGGPNDTGGDARAGSTGAIDRLIASLPALIEELAAGAVVELEVAAGDARLYLHQRPVAPPPTSVMGTGRLAEAAASAAQDEHLAAVNAPLAGVFYAAPAPGEPPYVREGDEVEQGQVVALIEAMKVFNEIYAEVAGTVVQILVTTGQLVQTGQTLIRIRPHILTPDDAEMR